MLKQVIQTTKTKSKLFSILHRGHEEYSSDPYSNNLKNNTHGKFVGRSKQTLGTNISSTRCSSTLPSYIKNNRNIRIAGISASFALLIISALTIYPIVKNSESAEAAGTAVPSTTTLTMTTNYENANLDLVVKDSEGTFASSSNNDLAKFGITTNNYTGYTLSISGPANTDLVNNSSNGSDNNSTNNGTDKVFTSIDSILDAESFTKGSGNLYNGKYGYLPSMYNSEENTYFRPAPSTSAQTLNTTECANGATDKCPNETDNYTIGLGARADYNTPSGTYTNTFILTLVANPVGYSISYADVSGDSSVDNIPAPTSSAISGTTSDTKVNLTTSVPTRTRYAFQYWCLGEEGLSPTEIVTDDGTVCHGTTYDSGAEFGISQIAETVTTLYAVWKLNAYDITIKTATGISSVSLQNADGGTTSCTSASGCVITGLISGQSYTLTATAAAGYTFSSWNAGSNGTIANTSSASTSYTVGAGESTITPSTTLNKYNITIRAASNVSKVTLNGTECTSTSGCTVSLEYGKSYSLSATYTTTSYNFGSWSNSANIGTIANASAASTTFTVGLGATTLTPSTTSCSNTISGYMQNASATSAYCASASGSMTDNRDSKSYTVKKINGQLWMTSNLRFEGTSITTTNTNINVNKSLTWRDLVSYSGCLGFVNSDNNTTELCKKNGTDGEGNATVWYNYAAATAGTITGVSNSDNAAYSLCPFGWRLPTDPEFRSLNSFVDIFNPVTGGRYSDGKLEDGGSYTFGMWWTSSRYNSSERYLGNYLGWRNSISWVSLQRYNGVYVRCVRS